MEVWYLYSSNLEHFFITEKQSSCASVVWTSQPPTWCAPPCLTCPPATWRWLYGSIISLFIKPRTLIHHWEAIIMFNCSMNLSTFYMMYSILSLFNPSTWYMQMTLLKSNIFIHKPRTLIHHWEAIIMCICSMNLSTSYMMYSSLSLFNPSTCYMEMTVWKSESTSSMSH